MRYTHSFLLQSTHNIPEFQLQLKVYNHPSNARLYHFESQDQNQTFATIFPSHPNSSKGTPHILEHLICCGSKKYPVRDPFMAMCRRSLNSYLNAWTGPDYICFPFASLNQQDFLNLQTVILDLVFQPTLSKLDFHQEGCRLDYDETLQYKGVVYNEMKGAMQNADSVFGQYIQKYVLNGTIYQFNSGGDPSEIPKLSYEELVNYYKETFDPSKAVFFQYGKHAPNFELLQQYLERKGNGSTDKNYENNPSPKEAPEILDLPKQEGNKQSHLAFSYLIQCEDIIHYLGLQIINQVLFENQSGLLYPIIEEGLAEAFSRNSDIEQFGNNYLFNISFQGVAEERKSLIAIQQRIEQVLQNLQGGFPKDKVEAALHQLEASYKMPSAEQGLRLLQNLMNSFVNDGNIVEQLRIDKNLQILREKINKGYLEQLVKQHLQKPHIIYGQPNPEYLVKLINTEKQQLNQIVADLSEIEKLNAALNNREESDQSILPTMTISDITLQQEKTNFNNNQVLGVKIYETIQNTNGIIFFKLKFNLDFISDASRQYLDMFCTLFPKFGTEEHTHKEMSQLFSENTLGLDISYETVDHIGTYVTFSVSCLNRNTEKTINLLTELLTKPLFKDTKHLSTLLRNQSIALQNEIIEAQLQYATDLASSQLSYSYHVTNAHFSTQFQLNYAKNFLEADGFNKRFYVDDFDFQMNDFLYLLMNKNRMSIIIHQDGQAKYNFEPLISALKDKYKAFNLDIQKDLNINFTPTYSKKAVLLPSQINCSARTYKIPSFTHKDTPSLQVLADYFANGYLHREIREKGGAYGAGCNVRSFKGVMNLWSYQDPNVLQTFNIFDQLRLDLNNQQFNEAKITVFQRLDQPIEPQNKGVDQLTLGYTDEEMTNFRTAILETTPKQLETVFEKYIKNQKWSQATMASEEHEDVKNLQGWEISRFNIK